MGVYDWARRMVARFGLGGDVLDVGAACPTGSVRSVFPAATRWTGIDLEPGPYVDVVGDIFGHLFPDLFDGAVCTEVLEHVAEPEELLADLRDLVRPGGWLLVSTRGPGFPLHDWPTDKGRRWTLLGLQCDLGRNGWAVGAITHDPTPNQPGVMALAFRGD